ncbi:MAG: SDR family oxidoreductase [Gammaproteobacteria bacterium]|nr:SDR family oxidoreductase [Gammaproteobacteria bacterium]
MGVRRLFDLTGKTALVTGGSRGLGLQMARALGEMGATVVLTARKADELAAALARLESAGCRAQTLVHDLAHLDTIPALVDQVIERAGTIDILVNNAGTTWGAPAEEHPLEAWRRVMTLNVDAAFRLSQYVAQRGMIPRRSGKIINVASILGFIGSPRGMRTAAYNSSKGALISLTRSLAAEWGPYNINVNAICPGFFPTKMSAGVLTQLETAVIDRTPLQRLGSDEDLMGSVVFLASEASRHVTGHCLVVDGGFTCA